jgi:hypothetical protein
MDDTMQTNQFQQSLRQQLSYIRHLHTDRQSVRMIPFLMEFTAERLKAQMLGGQAKTIALRGYERADHE